MPDVYSQSFLVGKPAYAFAMHIFFSVGEPSGDLHGANLIRELKQREPGVRCVGFGGPKMRAAGVELHEDLTKLAVMWFLRVLLNLHKFWFLYQRAKAYFRDQRPDAVVLIDYPGFNWWIARAAKRHNIPVFYYGAPQMWAWAPWRIHKMRRLIDHTLCKLPFEARWYNEQGCPATFVGHPYYDEMERQQLDDDFVRTIGAEEGRLITLLPGSRTQEVLNNLPWILKAAGRVADKVPDARFAVASFNEKQATIAREMVHAAGIDADVFVSRTPELIHLAHSCIACSGSVSLELLHHKRPTVIIYHVSRLAARIATLFIRVKHITLVNLLADPQPFLTGRFQFNPTFASAQRQPFPEYPSCEDPSQSLAAHVIEWLTDHQKYQAKVTQLAKLRAEFGHSGASRTAAD
ncbi:MAG TPA: lipid-A-disaccharide synthase, partial [Pirellulaceae bacterium]|nr:lipid-A-disaccharide synthase [Pirellulaceae bacterium]